ASPPMAIPSSSLLVRMPFGARNRTVDALSTKRPSRRVVTAQVVPQKAACGRARDRKANFSSANSPTDRLSEGVPGHHRGVPGQLRRRRANRRHIATLLRKKSSCFTGLFGSLALAEGMRLTVSLVPVILVFRPEK